MGAATDRLVSAIKAHGFQVKSSGRGRYRAQCPHHRGDGLNLAIADGDQGALVKCFSADCYPEDIAASVGLTLSDLFDEGGRAVYDYGGGHKVIRTRLPHGRKKIIQDSHPGKVTQFYRHPDSEPLEHPSGHIVLVEGEKCVDAALRLGEKCVTTWPGGAPGVATVDLNVLGGREVFIIADNDEPGITAAQTLYARLQGFAASVQVFTHPEPKKSVDDLWLEGGRLSQLVPVATDGWLEPEPAVADRPERVGVLRKLSTVKSKRMPFLWEGIIPMNSVTLFGARGGVGKSTFAIWLMGRVTRGEIEGDLNGQPANVLYVSHEDSEAHVVRPRADANGVDTESFYMFEVDVKQIGVAMMPNFPADLPILREKIIESGAKLVVIDPITSTLSGDNDKIFDVRSVMDPLNVIAAELEVTIIAIAHFKKGSGSASDMISGSHAWRDAARCVVVFAKEDESPEAPTVLTVEKSNYGVSGQSYSFSTSIVRVPSSDGDQIEVGKVVWDGASQRSVGEIINSTQRRPMGALSIQVLELIKSVAPQAISTKEILEEFSDEKRATIDVTLSRLRKKGAIDNLMNGVWRFIPPEESGRSFDLRGTG